MRNITIQQAAQFATEYKRGTFKDRSVYMDYKTLIALHAHLGDDNFREFVSEKTVHTTPEGTRFIDGYGPRGVHAVTRKISYRAIVIYSDNRPAETVAPILDWEWNADAIRCKMYPTGEWVNKPAAHVRSIKEIKEIRYHSYGSDYNDLIEEVKSMGLHIDDAIEHIRKETQGIANLEEVREILTRG